MTAELRGARRDHPDGDRTIAFVDLAGYTALTEAHGDHASIDLLDEFTANAREAVAASGAELVKSVGDAVMLAASTPAAGLEAVRLILTACYASDAFPEPRAGLHHGPVVAREGDYFGATVNLAARVAGRAGMGRRWSLRRSLMLPLPRRSTSSTSASRASATSSTPFRCGRSSSVRRTWTLRSIRSVG